MVLSLGLTSLFSCESDDNQNPEQTTVESLLLNKDWKKQSDPDKVLRFNSDGTLTGSSGQLLLWVWVKEDAEPYIITLNPIAEYFEITNLTEESLSLRVSLFGPDTEGYQWIEQGIWISE